MYPPSNARTDWNERSMAVQVSATRIEQIGHLIEIVNEHDIKGHDRFFDFDVAIWYRGQPNADDNLTPGVFRDDFLTSRGYSDLVAFVAPSEFGFGFEVLFNKAFRRRAAAFMSSDISLEALYILMQHHGMPTRLLDWTTNPLAALFFAVSQNADKDGAVYVLEPNTLLTDSTLPMTPVNMDSVMIKQIVGTLFGEPLISMDNIIIPVVPQLAAGRMFQQNSCFTFHLLGCDTLEEHKAAKIHKFIVPAAVKSDLQLILRRLGINYASIFYDLDNLAREMKAELNNPNPSRLARKPRSKKRS
jgi:hypothetical protein